MYILLPKLYRRRFIPDEKIHLKNDEIVKIDNDVIITKWKSLKPRKDISHGISCVFLKKNIKVSKVFDTDNSLVYYYCDIIDVDYDETTNSYTTNDLLVDVLVLPDGFVKVVDLGEIPEALDKRFITNDDVKNILLYLDRLLQIIYNKKFKELANYLEI